MGFKVLLVVIGSLLAIASCLNASTRGAAAAGVARVSSPIFGILGACCASAASGTSVRISARTNPISRIGTSEKTLLAESVAKRPWELRGELVSEDQFSQGLPLGEET